MNKRLWLVIAMLAAAVLACNLGSGDNDTAPTLIPTSIIALPTATVQPTIQPTITPIPTSTSTTAPFSTVVACTPYTSWPSVTVQAGDTLYGIALQVNSTVDELARANCLASADAIIAGQRLYVPNLPPPVLTATPNPVCPYPWFFSFDPGMFDTRAACPNPAQSVSAAGEDFEGGRALWYAALPGSTDPRGTIYIIYNDGSWESFTDNWTTGQPESDPSFVPPAGRYQPVRGIGKVWRENPAVRQRLGWAYEPEIAFTGRFQEPTGYAGIWYNTTPYFYLDHGKWGLVLRMYAVNMGPNTWEIAGRY